MEFAGYIVAALVIFVVSYKYLFNRKDFRIIRYIKKRTGCNEATAHRFVAYAMSDSLGRIGWKKYRDRILVDDDHLREFLLPIFILWLRHQAPEGTDARAIDIDLTNRILEYNKMTLNEAELLYQRAVPIMRSFTY